MKINLIYFLLILLAFACVPAFAQTHAGGSIKGKLVKATGKPLPYTEIELVPVNAKKIVIDARLLGISDGAGNFSFNNLPDGRYTLSINFDDKPSDLSPYETFFYPAATERRQAEVFEINSSTKVAGIVFRLPAPLVQRKIIGKAVLDDGKPAAGAFIAMRDVLYDKYISFGVAKADKAGNFSVTAFAGRTYQLGAITFENDAKTIWDASGRVTAGGESEIFLLDAATPVIIVDLTKSPDASRIKDKYLGQTTFPNRRNAYFPRSAETD